MQNRNSFSWVKEQMTRSISVLIMIYVITRASFSNAYPIMCSKVMKIHEKQRGELYVQIAI
ncbi:cytochrome f [Iris pallida]|uniref:Cytochrome f (Plastid) n=1 Tax=Iris pallida TaxID=29817 RepID=A0AAX6F7X1_IRIPA|nr:cytochrome f [Iris pallida]